MEHFLKAFVFIKKETEKILYVKVIYKKFVWLDINVFFDYVGIYKPLFRINVSWLMRKIIHE